MPIRNVALKEIMIKTIITAAPQDALSSIEEKFRKNRIRHIPVVDAENKILGIITHRDLLRYVPPHHTEQGDVYVKEEMDRFILKRIMTPDPLCLKPDDKIIQAVEIMARNKYGCIPFAAEDRTLLGIVTQIDILKFLYRILQET